MSSKIMISITSAFDYAQFNALQKIFYFQKGSVLLSKKVNH